MRGLTAHADRDPDEVGGLLSRLVSDDVPPGERGRLLGRLAAALARQSRRLVDTVVSAVIDVAPRLPVRDLSTLQAHYGGRSGDALADAVIESASRSTAAIGAAGGAVAAIEWTAPPTLLSAPVQLAAETLATIAVELRCVAELHAVYGVIVPGTPTQQATAYVSSWARRRGADPGQSSGLVPSLTAAARRRLRQRVVRRIGRNVSTLAPMLVGAAAGAGLNRRETRVLGDAVAADLRGSYRR